MSENIFDKWPLELTEIQKQAMLETEEHNAIPVVQYNEENDEFWVNIYSPEWFFKKFLKEHIRSEIWDILDYHEKDKHGKPWE